MKPEDVREFLDRPWELLERARTAHAAQRYREGGSAASVRMARELHRRRRLLRPAGPTPEERSADLAHHVELKRRMDRASDVLAGR